MEQQKTSKSVGWSNNHRSNNNQNNTQNRYNNTARNENQTQTEPMEDDSETEDEDEERTDWPIDKENKIINLSIMRPTDIPNRSINLPPPLIHKKEMKLQQVKQELMKTTEQYIKNTEEKHKANKTSTYDANLTKQQIKGIKSLQKNKDVIVFTTDKTGLFTADTPENYKEASEVHTTEDTIITEEEHNTLQKQANAHATIWTRITKAGENNKSEKAQDRIKSNLMVKNNGHAPLYALRKDHKPCEDQTKGPKTRPVCSGSSAYNRKLSHLISKIIRPLWQEEETISTNTEEVMAAFSEVNNKNIDTEIVVGSADVKALYPSLDIEHTAHIVGESFYHSQYEFTEIDNRELSLYIVLNLTQEEIEAEKISKYCHKRKSNRGAPPVITGCATDNKPSNRYKPWDEPEETPDDNTQKKMISIALRIAIKFIMKNHVYSINGVLKKQKKGGPIGLELTGDIAQVYMAWWDKQMIEKLRENDIILLIYKRYVDDINFIINTLKQIQEGRNKEEKEREDQRIMDKIREIGNTIHKSIELETDTPSKHKDKKMPVLDLKVWDETRKDENGNMTSKVLHEFYAKEISNKSVTHADSAMSMQSKRNILTSEMLRVFLRCSPLLDWSITAQHATEMNRRLQHSGYSIEFRKQITKSALNKYREIQDKDKKGECPMYRNRQWKKTEREKKKRQNKTNWYKKNNSNKKYKSVLFVQATPKSQLQKQYQKVINKHKLKIKVIEKAGTQVKNLVQRSDPFKANKCSDPKCFPCQNNNENKATKCRKEGIVYTIKCNKCTAQYIGESSHNAYTRDKEHKQDYDTKRECSVMLRHTETHHKDDTDKPEYTMNVTQIYTNKCMDRQISEAIQINNVPFIDRINSKIEYTQNRLPVTSFTWE